eukprot:1156372-Pelagomonas_calceolata.AAC.2
MEIELKGGLCGWQSVKVTRALVWATRGVSAKLQQMIRDSQDSGNIRACMHERPHLNYAP